MKEKPSFRHDPLYRVMDVTKEIHFIEGNFKRLFDRLKGINNLGIIPEVLEMARYPKYEHHLGTVHQIECLLGCVNDDIIPDTYRLPLKLSALFLHVGHLPFTYSTERALLLASGLGIEERDNKARGYVREKIENVLRKANFDGKKQQQHLEKLFSLENYKILYRYFSSEIFLKNWKAIRNTYRLEDECKGTIVRNLIDPDDVGYRYLELADKADFVQRDALYFGTVRLDVSPQLLYGQGLLGSVPESYTVDERKLIESNLDYLRGRFYEGGGIRWFSRIYEKIIASLILCENFKIEWLDKLDDSQLKRLTTENIRPDNKPAGLPTKWTKRAKDLFRGAIVFSIVFKLSNVYFEKHKNVIDIEYELLQKAKSVRGLLTYPFEKGALLDIDYLRKFRFPPHPNYRQFSIAVFQNSSRIKFVEIIKIIKQLTNYCSIIDIEDIKISDVRTIREGLSRQLSWTGSIRINNENVVKAVSEAIGCIENGDVYKKGDFLIKFLNDIHSIETFHKLWHNFQNRLWSLNIEHTVKAHREDIESSGVRNDFVEGMLSLPVRLLQCKHTKKHLDQIYEKLLEMICITKSDEKKGYLFEALWLIHKIRETKGTFKFLINGMVVVDPKMPKDKRDIHEFDVIEILTSESGNAECWIYACCIADDYRQKNKTQLEKLAENIHKNYPGLKIRTRYIIPEDRSREIWRPKEAETGVGYVTN